MPLRTQFNDFVVQLGGNAAAHSHNHRLALKHFLPFLEVCDNIFRYVFQTVRTTYQGFELCPFRLCLLDIVHVVSFKLLVKVFDKLAPLVAEFNLGETAFVEDTHGGTILNRLCNIVNINIVAKYRWRILVGSLDGRSRETEIGGIGQGIAKIFCKAVLDFRTDDFIGFVLHIHILGLETVLRAVSLVCHDNYIAAVCKGIVNIACFGLKLLYGGKNHATRLHRQQFLQVLAVFGLHWRLLKQLLCTGESVEKLVVQVVAVGDYDNCRVVEPLHDFSRVEYHRERLAAALRVPYHTCAMVARMLFLYSLEAIVGRRFRHYGESVDSSSA